jgi:hypothetical protein
MNKAKYKESGYDWGIEILGRVVEQAKADYLNSKDHNIYNSAKHYLFNKKWLEQLLVDFNIDFDIESARKHLLKLKNKGEK